MIPEAEESLEERYSIQQNEFQQDAQSNSHTHLQLTTLEIFANPTSRSGPTILNPPPTAMLIKTVPIKRSCFLLLNH